jgi:hypothetical protein
MGVLTAVLLLAAPIASATSTLPSGEHTVGQSTVEPAYNDMNGQIVYILTPNHAPFPVNSNNRSWAPLYIVLYPAGSTVGTLNCMGVPGNCPDHDGEVAGAATAIMPGVYGSDPTKVIGHDHLLAAPASGGDFNIAWQVYLVLFTNASFVNQHITTLSALTNASGLGEVIEVPTPIVFHCSVVPAAVYNGGTPVSA